MNKYYINDLQERYNLKTRQSVYNRLKAIGTQVEKEGNKSYITDTVLEKLDQLQEHLNLGGSIISFTPTVKTTVHSKIDNENFDSSSPIDSINLTIDKANSSDNSINLTIDKANSSDNSINLTIDKANSSDNSVNFGLDKVNSPDNSVNFGLDKVNSPDNSNIQYIQLNLFESLMEKVEEIVERIIPINPISHWEKLDIAAEKGYILSTKEVQTLLGTKPSGTTWARGAFIFTRTGKIGNQAGWRISRL
jgi:predicted RND superfamily exporter protein